MQLGWRIGYKDATRKRIGYKDVTRKENKI